MVSHIVAPVLYRASCPLDPPPTNIIDTDMMARRMDWFCDVNTHDGHYDVIFTYTVILETVNRT